MGEIGVEVELLGEQLRGLCMLGPQASMVRSMA